jgi:integrase/recombinase XerC
MNLLEAHGHFQVQLAADGRSEHTKNQYARHVRSLIVWLTKNGRSVEIAEITPAVVAEFFGSDHARQSARGGLKKATSANAQRTSLRNFFRWSHESGLTAANAARLLRRAHCAPPPPRALHADEQERLRNALAKGTGPEAARDRMLVELLLGTGIRIGSAIALDVGDVDLEHGELALRKTKGNRPASALLPKALARELKAFLAGRADGPVFRAASRRVSLRHAQRRLTGSFAAAGIKGSAHSLRHSYATSLLERTGDLRLVQAALNHASIISTTAYANVDTRRLRAAVGT